MLGSEKKRRFAAESEIRDCSGQRRDVQKGPGFQGGGSVFRSNAHLLEEEKGEESQTRGGEEQKRAFSEGRAVPVLPVPIFQEKRGRIPRELGGERRGSERGPLQELLEGIERGLVSWGQSTCSSTKFPHWPRSAGH